MPEINWFGRFSAIPVIWQNVFCFLAMVVCLVSLTDMILLVRQKRRRKSGLAVLAANLACLLTGYAIMHVCMVYTNSRRVYAKMTGVEFSLSHSDRQMLTLMQNLKAFPVVAALAFSMLGSMILLIHIFRWRGRHIVENSIKESMDYLPAGVCYYRENGLILLLNHRMYDWYFQMTGETLQNGKELEAVIMQKQAGELSGKIICRMPEMTVVSFRHRTFSYEEETVHEIIADDVTELYKKSEKLKSDNEKARILSESMRTYGKNIDEVVRRQEILQAKINIHDEMNRMILSTGKVMEEDRKHVDPDRRQEILHMWKNQMTLLKQEGKTEESHVLSDLNVLAKHLGLKIEWNGKPVTEDREVLFLFLMTAREAMMNAVKHAGAGTLWIFVDKQEKSRMQIQFTNDGLQPEKPVAEGGGLKNIRRKVEEAGGRMEIEWKPQYRMTVDIPCTT